MNSVTSPEHSLFVLDMSFQIDDARITPQLPLARIFHHFNLDRIPMQSNGNYTVWIGDRCIAVPTADIENLRSKTSKTMNDFSDAVLATFIAQGQMNVTNQSTLAPRLSILNETEIRLIQEARASIPSRLGSPRYLHRRLEGPSEN